MRRLELARPLRVQIAPLVDRGDECGSTLHGTIERRSRLRRLVFERGELQRAGLQRLPFFGERVERPFVRLDAFAIEVRHGRRCPVDAAERAQIIDVEEQPPVAGAAQAIEVDEAGFDVGAIGIGDLLERLGPCRRFVQSLGRLGLLTTDRCDLFDLDLPIEFELAQLDEQLTLLGDQRFSLALERANALARALRRRWRRASGRFLARERKAESDRTESGKGEEAPHQKSALPSTAPGMGTPKNFRTVGAISMIDGASEVIGLFEMTTPAVVAKS